MAASRAIKAAFKCSPPVISWKSTGKIQQTISSCIERTGLGLHSGKESTVRIRPELAGEGRYFALGLNRIDASIGFARESRLCTTLCKDGYSVRTVEHLLSALEACGIDNCRIEVENSVSDDQSVEVPIFDGSAREWVRAIQEVGLEVAAHPSGENYDKLAPYVNEPIHMWKNDAFIAAFPSSNIRISYGINFPQAPAIGCQWFSCSFLDNFVYVEQIASSRTFCIYEQVEKIWQSGLIQGGSLESAIVCSESRGWLNAPLRYDDEPCRHKVLDLIGDLSLLARAGSQGLPVAHIVVYKGGHALHTDFVRHLSSIE
ncbi:hypothetical protein DM860_017863 [Cuscuta australis]|uniref:UDP-3-O-acyl-N-acetylglucosamine deacetylase n=1 Tax=Cuscuta australis TaxID=267555 RepID=A0A328DQZ0_9ASTE|nr:hypothetical protein DM860_017863 [Cuscuta australis]